ncbi:uncharacterized protein LOC123402855 [Hordeum vulgare subsp. vulgare]|uniref:uncharacterized protein LOC123402855 n=1 Tax=Hordeum vulgare subsp. vulgare TaxID=112509 RepID=UPI001D1A5539|nr:uncharacterized protein LOC123402855 [Hordeum vulgare subsp. vulgare]
MRFNCERVTQGGPWNFRGNPVIIAPYDGYSKPSSIEFTPYDGYSKPSTIELFTFAIWARIIDLSLAYHGKVKALASKLDDFVDAEPSSFDFEGNFYRVRVRLDVCKPLKKAISLIRGGQREIFAVRYERLPDWCQVCGMMGHEFKEHGDGVHSPVALVFKNLRWGTRRRNNTKKNNEARKTDDGTTWGMTLRHLWMQIWRRKRQIANSLLARKISLSIQCR